MEEAVAALLADGPAVNAQIQQLSQNTRVLQERVRDYESEVQSLEAGLAEQEAALGSAAQSLEQLLGECQRELDLEMTETDNAVLALQRFLGLTQGEFHNQMEIASGKLKALSHQLDGLNPVLQQAVVHQKDAFGKTQRAIDSATDTLGKTVAKAMAEYDGLKRNVAGNQKLMATQVGALVAQVKQVQTRSSQNTQKLVANSQSIVSNFESNLKTSLQTNVNKPGEQMQAGMKNLTTYAEKELQKSLNFLAQQGLNRALGALGKISERNGSIIKDLQRLVPGELSQGARSLGNILMNLDTILKALAKRAVNWLTGIINAGLDWFSEKTGINLDFVKNSVKAISGLALAGIDLMAGQIRLAKTLITNPANLTKEIENLVTDARGAARAMGKLVGV